jgi:hypothetical protein
MTEKWHCRKCGASSDDEPEDGDCNVMSIGPMDHYWTPDRIIELPEGHMLPRDYHYGPKDAYQHYDFPSGTWRPPGAWRAYNHIEPYFFVSNDGRDAQVHINAFLAKEVTGTVFVYRSNGTFAAFRPTPKVANEATR